MPASRKSKEARERLARQALVLADRDAPKEAWAEAVHDFYQLLLELTSLEVDASSGGRSLRLGAGVAIAPADAARCVIDPVRTARCLQGLTDAVREAARRFGPPVEVVYAGCGPFAPFCFLPATLLGPDLARFTLLEVHPGSRAAVGRALEALGMEASVRALLEADATTYQHDGPLHVVVSEALERALGREPQVAIALNLAPQLAPGGILVPERIRIEACLAHAAAEVSQTARGSSKRHVLGTVFDLTLDSARRFAEQGFEEVTLCVPAVEPGGPADLMLGTTITFFGAAQLHEFESGITFPSFRFDLGRLSASGFLDARYVIGPNPGFALKSRPIAAPPTAPSVRSEGR